MGKHTVLRVRALSINGNEYIYVYKYIFYMTKKEWVCASRKKRFERKKEERILIIKSDRRKQDMANQSSAKPALTHTGTRTHS